MTDLGNAFGAATTGEFTAFKLAKGALDRGKFASGGIVATHTDKTKGNATLIAPLTTVLIMNSLGFIAVTPAGCLFIQDANLPTAFAGVIACLGTAGPRCYLRQQPMRRSAPNSDEQS